MMNKDLQESIARLIDRVTSAKSEKREYFRLSLHLPMEYSFPDSSGHRVAYTVDISEGGLLMYSSQKLEVGQNLNLKFYFHSAAGLDYVQALGEIIRVDRLGKSEKECRYAVRFVDLSSDTSKKLRKFLKSLY
jgi:c-di-GMP-binding flagellar brake protein YcgR